jgi:hypothetical protein
LEVVENTVLLVLLVRYPLGIPGELLMDSVFVPTGEVIVFEKDSYRKVEKV